MEGDPDRAKAQSQRNVSLPSDSARGHRRDSLLGAGSNLVVYALALLTGPLLGRSLGPAGRGDLAAVLTPTQLWAWSTTYGLPGATAYYAPDVDRSELMTSAWVVTAAVNIPLVALAWFLVPVYLSGHDPATVGWFRAILVSTLVALPSVTTLNHLNGIGRTLAFTVLRHLPTVSYSGAVVLLSITGRLTLPSALAATLLANVASAVAALGVGRGWPGHFRRATLALQWRYGSRLALGQVAGLTVGRLDQLLMVRLVASAELGRYAVAATAASAGSAFSQGLAFALFPRVRQADTARLRRREVRRASRWVLAGSATMALITASTAPWLLPAMFGSGFREAVPALWILLPGQIASDRLTVLAAGLQASGKPGVATRGMVLASVCTVLGIFPAVSQGGIKGAALVTTLSQVAALAYVSRQTRRFRVAPLSVFVPANAAQGD